MRSPESSIVLAAAVKGKSRSFWATARTLLAACAQKPFIVPIPGTRELERMVENIGAVTVNLTSADLREIESTFSKITVQGPRLSEEQMDLIDS